MSFLGDLERLTKTGSTDKTIYIDLQTLESKNISKLNKRRRKLLDKLKLMVQNLSLMEFLMLGQTRDRKRIM